MKYWRKWLENGLENLIENSNRNEKFNGIFEGTSRFIYLFQVSDKISGMGLIFNFNLLAFRFESEFENFSCVLSESFPFDKKTGAIRLFLKNFRNVSTKTSKNIAPKYNLKTFLIFKVCKFATSTELLPFYEPFNWSTKWDNQTVSPSNAPKSV